jgi:hypothetical protein
VLTHLTAHAFIGQRPLADTTTARWLWSQLRCAFPSALSACLMPNHVHLLVDVRDVAAARLRLAKVLGAASRIARTERTWITAPPAPVRDQKQLARQVRYLHLNPSRAKLATDPLEWAFSTHRGAVGAEVDPWVDAERLARALGVARDGFEFWLHRYVSGDPSVAPNSTPFPVPAPRAPIPAVPISDIVLAAAAATPWSPRRTRQRVIVLLARHQGWRGFALLARAAKTSKATAWRYAQFEDPALLRPATFCLADARLRAGLGVVSRRG